VSRHRQTRGGSPALLERVELQHEVLLVGGDARVADRSPCLCSLTDSSGVITGAIVPKPSDGFMPSDRRVLARGLTGFETSHDGCPRNGRLRDTPAQAVMRARWIGAIAMSPIRSLRRGVAGQQKQYSGIHLGTRFSPNPGRTRRDRRTWALPMQTSSPCPRSRPTACRRAHD
jgi:hypothetical protein